MNSVWATLSFPSMKSNIFMRLAGSHIHGLIIEPIMVIKKKASCYKCKSPPPNYSHYVMKVILIGRLNRCLMIDECKNWSRITSKESPSPVGTSKTDGEAKPSWKKTLIDVAMSCHHIQSQNLSNLCVRRQHKYKLTSKTLKGCI
jgi:hypothetical protein